MKEKNPKTFCLLMICIGSTFYHTLNKPASNVHLQRIPSSLLIGLHVFVWLWVTRVLRLLIQHLQRLLASRWHASLNSCRSELKYCLFVSRSTNLCWRQMKWASLIWGWMYCPLRTYWLGTRLLHSFFCYVWEHGAWAMSLIRLWDCGRGLLDSVSLVRPPGV